jgi:excinuclease ABC subunit B
MAEELTEYLLKNGISTAYIHSDVDTLERVKIMEDLRAGIYNVLVGVNLLSCLREARPTVPHPFLR